MDTKLYVGRDIRWAWPQPSRKVSHFVRPLADVSPFSTGSCAKSISTQEVGTPAAETQSMTKNCFSPTMITHLSGNSVTAFGKQVYRPPGMTSCHWQEFWRGKLEKWGDRGKWPQVDIGSWTTVAFGVIFTRPDGMTLQEWEDFWSDRSLGAQGT